MPSRAKSSSGSVIFLPMTASRLPLALRSAVGSTLSTTRTRKNSRGSPRPDRWISENSKTDLPACPAVNRRSLSIAV